MMESQRATNLQLLQLDTQDSAVKIHYFNMYLASSDTKICDTSNLDSHHHLAVSYTPWLRVGTPAPIRLYSSWWQYIAQDVTMTPRVLTGIIVHNEVLVTIAWSLCSTAQQKGKWDPPQAGPADVVLSGCRHSAARALAAAWWSARGWLRSVGMVKSITIDPRASSIKVVAKRWPVWVLRHIAG